MLFLVCVTQVHVGHESQKFSWLYNFTVSKRLTLSIVYHDVHIGATLTRCNSRALA